MTEKTLSEQFTEKNMEVTSAIIALDRCRMERRIIESKIAAGKLKDKKDEDSKRHYKKHLARIEYLEEQLK